MWHSRVLIALAVALGIAGGAAVASTQTSYIAWPENGLTKVFRSALPPTRIPRAVRMYAARSEYESAQLVIRARTQALKHVMVTAGDLVCSDGGKLSASCISLYRVAYIHLPAVNADYPDPLPPLTPFDVAPETSQPVWITVYVPKGTPPGDYTGKLNISAAGEPDRVIPVQLKVWIFTLPDTPTSRTAFGISGNFIAQVDGLDTKSRAYQELLAQYYLALLEHRISAYDPPVALSSPDVGEYLNDARVTGFVIPYSNDVTSMRADVERCRQSGWLPKAYFYPLDEPYTADSYRELKERADRVHSIDRSLKVVSPFFRGPDFPTDKSMYELLDGYLDIWCPNLAFYDEEAMHAKQAKGEEVWWYVCCGPGAPFPNFFVNMAAIDHRILMWMQKLYDVQGLLYWSTTYWNPSSTKDVWEDVATVKDINPNIYGDGSLFYPGSKVGLAQPITSIRLECIRDGLEDFDYLTMLERKIGAAKMKELIERLVERRTVFGKSPQRLLLVRREIARQLESEYGRAAEPPSAP
jgi:hypothetical protein